MKTFINNSIAARTYTAIETFHTPLERSERMDELRLSEEDISFKEKVAFDIEDAYLLEYTICMKS
jgi:hypothetical protein